MSCKYLVNPSLQQTAFENIVGKGEVAHNKQFLLFPQCFLFNQIKISSFLHIFDIISLFAPEFEEHKLDNSGKGLNMIVIHVISFYMNI